MTVGTQGMWHKTLKKKELVELAMVLANHSLKAWTNFHLTSCSKPELKILPEKALKEIESALEENCYHKLNGLFTSFITPVLHIRDGHFQFPYEVRLAFLSVFHILQGMVSTNNLVTAKEAFSSSITKSIDAIKISGVLTADELSLITQKYYV